MEAVLKKQSLIIITEGYPIRESETSFLLPELSVLEKCFDITLIPKYSGEKPTKKLTCKYEVVECKFQPDFVKLVKWGILSIVDSRLWKEIFYTIRYANISIKIMKDIIINMMLSKNMDRVLKGVLSRYDEKETVIVYSYWYDYSLLSATSRYAKKKKVKVVARTHGFDLYNERCASGRQVYKEQVDKELRRVFFISEYGKRYYMNHFAQSGEEKYLLSYIGPNEQHYIQYKQSNVFHIVSCSYMVPLKRIDVLIQALSSIESCRIHWTHIGDGPMRKTMEELARDLLDSKNNVSYEFKGEMENEEILKYYANENIGCYILISDTEGLPFSIMEAMAFGIPAVANDVGGISEIISRDNGILLSEAKVESVAEALLQLAGLEETQMNQLRQNAFETWNNKFNGVKNAERLAEELTKI